MNASPGFRQFHRWTAMAFTLTVVANFAALALGVSAAWITYAPLPPLALLMLSGLCLFAQPHLEVRRSGRAGS